MKRIVFLLMVLSFDFIDCLGQDPVGAKRFLNHKVRDVSISPDGKYIVSGSSDNTIKIWNFNSGKEIKTLRGHTSMVESVAFSADSKFIVSGSWDNTIKVWDFNTGKEVKTLIGHTDHVNSVAICSDGKTIVSGSNDRSIKIWDLNKGREIKSLSGHSGWINSVALSTNGKYIVSGDWDNTVKVWELNTGREIKSITGQGNKACAVAISTDGKFIAVGNNYTLDGSKDYTIKVWELERGKEVKSFIGHQDNVNSLSFSSDSKYILSCSRDKTIKLWDLITKDVIQTWQLNLIPIFSTFLSDSKGITTSTSSYWVTLPLEEEEKINNKSFNTQTNKIYWTSPNANKYIQEPLKVSQDRLNIEAIISTTLTEKQLREALQVRVNGSLQRGKLGNVSLKAQQQEYDFEQSVQLAEGANNIEILIAPPNQEVTKSMSLHVFYTPAKKANLYLFTFGVQSDLNFTDEDAQTVHRLFKSQEGPLFNHVFAEGPYIEDKTDASNIAKELERFGNQEEIREQDVVLIFGSSHGDILNGDFRITGKDYDPASPKRSTISFKEDILANLEKLSCKKIIMLDACHSGATVGKKAVDANSLIANTPVGTATITSSKGIEKSYENKAWNNSSFVKAIREALEEGKANTNHDRYVTLQELFDYLQVRVPALVKSVKDLEKFEQHPQMKMEGMQDFPIYWVK